MKPGQPGYARTATAAAIAAGTAGVIMVVANVSSPVRAPLALLFLAVAPAAAVMPLLGRFDRLARLVVAGATAVGVNFLVAETMLAAGVWSPRGSAAVVAVLSAGCAASRLRLARLRLLRAQTRDAASKALQR